MQCRSQPVDFVPAYIGDIAGFPLAHRAFAHAYRIAHLLQRHALLLAQIFQLVLKFHPLSPRFGQGLPPGGTMPDRVLYHITALGILQYEKTSDMI